MAKQLINYQRLAYKEDTKYIALDLVSATYNYVNAFFDYLNEIGCFVYLIDRKYLIIENDSLFHLDIKFGDKFTFNGE